MKLKELIKNLQYQCLENMTNCEIKGISSNSRNIRPGYLFVALKGQKYDGHSFVNQAINKGAKAVIVQRDLRLKKRVTKILVQDSQLALINVCAALFEPFTEKLRVIGITGTNGKTTISYLIEKILTCAGYPPGVIGTINYRVGNKTFVAVNTTPQVDSLQSLLQKIVYAKSKYAIIEVSSHALAQRRTEGIRFCSAIFTNLTREHLDYHGSLANYFSAKLKLFEGLDARAWAIINIDDPWGKKLARRISSRQLNFGIECPAHIQAKNLKLGIMGSKFTVVTPRGNIEIESPLIGRHNVYNILAAISATFVENIDFSHIALGVKELSYVPGRLERIDCGQNFLVFVDYAHTEDALKNILLTVKKTGKRKIILIFGCGGERDKTKRPRMGKLATEFSDFVFITSDNPRSENPNKIISDILSGVNEKKTKNFKVVVDRLQAIQEALSMVSAGDIVIIAGKGHESVQILANKIIPFSDREVAEKILRCLPSKKY
jgi:UDP-N-acetylmuramoyl-L-alanyl-D-glutamate--2,6-diaminopimelate ligase